jgi:hypothetical protein
MDPGGLHGSGGGLGVPESPRYPWMSITGKAEEIAELWISLCLDEMSTHKKTMRHFDLCITISQRSVCLDVLLM